jgi:hypothetical protein
MRILAMLLCLIGASKSLAENQTVVLPAYNEAAQSSGKIRRPYSAFTKNTGIKIYPIDPIRAQHMLNQPLGDSIKILPAALVLPESDYRFLQKGAMQRSRALRAFFADVVLNRSRTILSSGILNEEQINSLVASAKLSLSYLRYLWAKRLPSEIHFVYGPDIVRDASGRFWVLEDNVGLIGGIGDIAQSHNAFFSQYGENPNLQPPLKSALEKYLADVPRERWAEDVMVIYSKKERHLNGSIQSVDEETSRILDIIEGLGLNIVSFQEMQYGSQPIRDMVNGKYKKVINLFPLTGLPIDSISDFNVDTSFRETDTKYFQGPGVDFLGSKALLPFVESFVQLYLNEKPLLSAPPTRQILFPKDIPSPSEIGWVVKESDGLQGKGVYILDTLDETGKELLRISVEHAAIQDFTQGHMPRPRFIAQRYVEASYLPADLPNSWVRFNIDYRPHVFVIGDQPEPPVIWGRGNWKIP